MKKKKHGRVPDAAATRCVQGGGVQLLLMATADAGDKGVWWNLAGLPLQYSSQSVSFKIDSDILTFGDELRR